jgi:SecY translocase/SecD-like export protein
VRAVSPRRAAAIAGALAAAFVIATYIVRTVPDGVVALVGGPDGGIARYGGLRVGYEPPPGADREVAAYVARNHGTTRVDSGVLAIEFPGLGEDAADRITGVLASGGLEFKQALETDDFAVIAQRAGVLADEHLPRDYVGPRLVVDRWYAEDGSHHTTFALEALRRADLRETIERSGWTPPPGTEVAYERVTYENRPEHWRTYLLASRVELDAGAILDATGSFDPNTGRPIILIDYTGAGSERFCEVTRRIVGHKLAAVFGGDVRSAPIINGPICGGHASVAMGGSDPDAQLAERDAVLAVLRGGAIPRGGRVVSREWFPPASIPLREWLGRLVLGLLAGLAVFVLAYAVVRFARPVHADRPVLAAGRFPTRRLFVTLLAPLVLLLAPYIDLPGVNTYELAHIMRHDPGAAGSVFALGITPVMFAFAIVEIVALAVPPLRWRRHDPEGRRKLARAVAILAIAFAALQGYFLVRRFELASLGGAELISLHAGWAQRGMLVLTLVAGTLVLVTVAGAISSRGLGNGYGVVIASGLVIDTLPDLGNALAPEYWMHYAAALPAGIAAIAAIAIPTAAVLRWRIVAHEREPALRPPLSGISPLGDVVTILGLVSTLAVLLDKPSLPALHSHVVAGAIALVSVVVWSWVLARPALVAARAYAADLQPPSRASWGRALGVTLAWTAVVFVVAAPVDRIALVLTTAVVLDIAADVRAHRAKLVAVTMLQQIQQLGVVERELAAAGIAYHASASHLRSLLAFFGPWAPVVILVPEADLTRAAELLSRSTRRPGA